MATFTVVISDPKGRKAYQREADHAASGLLGKKVGEQVAGGAFGLEGYSLEVTGGSDKEGFPMRADIEGAARKRVLLSSGPGFHPARQGERQRKSVRGNTISPDIVQVNAKVVAYGKKGVEELLGAKGKAETKEEKEAPPGQQAVKEAREGDAKQAEPKEAAGQAESAEKKMGVKKLE
ncbi:MAG: 30S ribosomal protein S6e [Candidatus Aenigmarchaeota archaeon]|nr:30S ribosomal protein S6e [Candidatus Aenigmarchaeota archaeon]